jgi:hypothetical protein
MDGKIRESLDATTSLQDREMQQMRKLANEIFASPSYFGTFVSTLKTVQEVDDIRAVRAVAHPLLVGLAMARLQRLGFVLSGAPPLRFLERIFSFMCFRGHLAGLGYACAQWRFSLRRASRDSSMLHVLWSLPCVACPFSPAGPGSAGADGSDIL